MADDRLTPEEQAVIEAAVKFASCTVGRGDLGRPLIEAVDAYRKATAPPEPPEPFQMLMAYHPQATDPYPKATYRDIDIFRDMVHGQLWRCTVTPVERVR